VVTLLGPGGIGKSSLAIEVARSVFPTFQGDTWLVELATLSDPSRVPYAVAGALDLKLSDEISDQAIARGIGEKKVLLVLDNCEHLVDACARVVDTIIRTCPNAVILATSRESMRIEAEQVYRVPALRVPPQGLNDSSSILEHSAIQLFIARAAASDSDFSPNAADLPSIVDICRRLDGIPLAIEFAAARVSALGLQHVSSGLDDRFALLSGGRRSALPRHRTLQATLDWSYELLSEDERRMLRRLASFSGGFTLESATAVAADAGDTEPVVLDIIANLVAKSLVVLEPSAGSSRWRLLETTRAYALGKLAASNETDQMARRHAEYFRDLIASPVPGSRKMDIALVKDFVHFREEMDNVRAAVDWCFSSKGDSGIGIVLTAAYLPVWLHLSLIAECRERAERALFALQDDVGLDEAIRVKVQVVLGMAEVAQA
jgi:predicted ATPase